MQKTAVKFPNLTPWLEGSTKESIHDLLTGKLDEAISEKLNIETSQFTERREQVIENFLDKIEELFELPEDKVKHISGLLAKVSGQLENGETPTQNGLKVYGLIEEHWDFHFDVEEEEEEFSDSGELIDEIRALRKEFAELKQEVSEMADVILPFKEGLVVRPAK